MQSERQNRLERWKTYVVTAQKMSKNGVFSGPYFPVFELNMRKYGPEKIPSLDTFYAVTTNVPYKTR